MSAARVIARNETLHIRLRATDRVIEAEVVEEGVRTRLRILGKVVGLRPNHFAMGVDVELLEPRARFALEDVKVLDFDADRKELRLPGPVELPHVRRRSTFREAIELDAFVAPYKGGAVGDVDGYAEAVPGKTVDLGGGGVNVELDRAIDTIRGQNVRLMMVVDGENVRALARVAWVQLRPTGQMALGLALIEVDNRGHDRLYRFLYDIQRSRRR